MGGLGLRKKLFFLLPIPREFGTTGKTLKGPPFFGDWDLSGLPKIIRGLFYTLIGGKEFSHSISKKSSPNSLLFARFFFLLTHIFKALKVGKRICTDHSKRAFFSPQNFLDRNPKIRGWQREFFHPGPNLFSLGFKNGLNQPFSNSRGLPRGVERRPKKRVLKRTSAHRGFLFTGVLFTQKRGFP